MGSGPRTRVLVWDVRVATPEPETTCRYYGLTTHWSPFSEEGRRGVKAVYLLFAWVEGPNKRL